MCLIITIQSCQETGHYDIDFNKNHTSINMIPSRYLTTWNEIKIEGNIDCRVRILIPGGNSIDLNPGKINYAKRHEWFDQGKTIQVHHDGCSKNSKLTIFYNYSASYW
jgi:hypothetical protein